MAETRLERWTRDYQYGIDSSIVSRFVNEWSSQDSDRQDHDCADNWAALL